MDADPERDIKMNCQKSNIHGKSQDMTRLLRNMLDGARNIISLFPDDDPRLHERIIPKRTDAEALQSDWNAIGRDMWQAMGRVDSEKQTRH